MASEQPQIHHYDFDLAGLRLSPGEGRRLELTTPIEPLLLGSEHYIAEPEQVPVELSVSRMTGGGYALRLHFSAKVLGPCMRCLKQAGPVVAVEAREVDRPGGGEELDSPYVHDETLDLAAGRATRLRWRCPRRSSAGRTAPVCALCVPWISTRPVPSTTTSPRQTRVGPSSVSSSSISGAQARLAASRGQPEPRPTPW